MKRTHWGSLRHLKHLPILLPHPLLPQRANPWRAALSARDSGATFSEIVNSLPHRHGRAFQGVGTEVIQTEIAAANRHTLERVGDLEEKQRQQAAMQLHQRQHLAVGTGGGARPVRWWELP